MLEPRILAAAGLLLCGSALGPAAHAQSFRLGYWTGFGEFGFDFQRQDQSSPLGDRPLFERAFAEQRLGLNNTATIGGAGLGTVNFGVTVGFEQSRLSVGEGQTDSGRGHLLGFDVTATILPQKPYSVILLASRVENVTPVEFAGTRELNTLSLGLTVGAGGRAFPGKFLYRSIDVEATSNLGESIRGIDQSRRTLTYTGENRWQRQQFSTFLEYQELDDRVAGSFSGQTRTVSLNHDVDLLRPQLVTLRSTLHYFDRRGELASSSFRLDEEFRLRHSANLSSGLRFELRSLGNFSGLMSDSWRGIAWVHHRLWDSLDTEAHVSRLKLTSDTGHSDIDDARLRLNYKKNLPLRGRLLGVFNTTYERRDNLRLDAEEFVSMERHTARFGVPFRLDQPLVVPGTVVVADELGAVIYEEGVDYELQLVGEFTEVLALPGGRITDGQVVVVDYQAGTPVQNETSLFTTDLGVSVDYGWIMPFFGLRTTRDRLLGGESLTLLSNRTDRVLGVRFNKNGSRFRLFSFSEARSREEPRLAYDSLRLANSLTYTPPRRWSLNVSLVNIDTRFRITPRETRIDDGRFGFRWRPLQTLSVEAYAGIRITRDTAAADQTFSRLGARGRYNMGKISLVGSIEQWRRDTNGIELDGLRASLRVSRRFFPGRITAPRRPVEREPWPDDLPPWLEPPDTEDTEGTEPGPNTDELPDGEFLELPADVSPEEGESEQQDQDDGRDGGTDKAP